MDFIEQKLFSLQDTKYRDFQSKLIPSVPKDSVIGVRTPELKAFAKSLFQENNKTPDKNIISQFLSELPHKYFDENQLHAFIISEEKSFETAIEKIEKFLPYIDNWATCDQLCPKIFKKHTAELLPFIEKWIKSEHTYTVRFAIKMLMQYFLDDNFSIQYLKLVSSVKSEEYYVKMMVAWYFATALAKQYDATISFLQESHLEKWTYNKAIQKALESYRISDEQKKYLKGLKIA